MATRRNRAAGPRVAIVEDHRLLLDGLQALIGPRRSGLDVVISETSWHGMLEHSQFPVDVAVVGLNLGDGIAIGTKIRALAAVGTRTVVLSRLTDLEATAGVLAAGASACIARTDSAAELMAAVTAAARGTALPSPEVDAAEHRHPADPGLGRQEQRAMMLYASGHSIKAVADEMQTTEETVKSYIKRARRKYRHMGVDVGTKILLRRRGIHEGWLTPE
ncbi:sigma factor-like helix-turn-helix DNA-binding protein [Marisediminicola senii]|uniref:sigma factor-like helix-turn-helix DNA-binding protein n=1 Tax=Marisediminicola senii TaxID=2711233 RepID=UPI0013ED9784|nr:response regulator transcription factor [Marisediminicola senii]